MVLQIHVTNKNHFISSTRVPTPPNLVQWWHTLKDSVKVILRFDHMFLQGHVTNKNHYMATTSVSMATNLAES